MRVERKIHIAYGTEYLIWDEKECLGVYTSKNRAMRIFKRLKRRKEKLGAIEIKETIAAT